MIVKVYDDTRELVGEILNAKNAHKEDAKLRIYSKALEVYMESHEDTQDIFEFLECGGFYLEWPLITIGKLIRTNHKPIDAIHILFRLLIGLGEILDGLIEILTLGYLVGYFGLESAKLMARRNYRKKHGH